MSEWKNYGLFSLKSDRDDVIIQYTSALDIQRNAKTADKYNKNLTVRIASE
jgi:hypothetical protein